MTSRELFYTLLGQTSPTPLGIEIDRAQGCTLYGPGGEDILDLISGIAVSNLGHANAEVLQAVREQSERHLHVMVYGELVQHPQVRLAGLLLQQLPPSLSQVFFVTSGSEAVEGAMKLAKRYTGRTEFVAFRNAYHGSTQGALSVCGHESLKNAFRPLLPGIHILPFNDSAALDRINDRTAAVLIEPIQGEAGVVLPDPGFLEAVRAACSRHGALLVFDEIQTGFGRTGTRFAFEATGVVPDVLVLGKALGAGMPLGAFIAGSHILSALTHRPVLGHITTFGGHPASCAAAYAGLTVLLRDRLPEAAEAKGRYLQEKLHHPLIANIRGKGLFLAVEFHSEATCRKVIDACIRRGVLTDWFLFAPHCMRLAPPLVITEGELETACRRILAALDEVAASGG